MIRRDILAAADIGRTREPEELLTGAQSIAEDFLALCGYLTFSRFEKPVRTILVTSPNPRDGKTLATINLALALAQFRKRVVLVDGNLRAPAVHIRLSRSLIDADELVLEGIPFTALPAAPNLLVLKASSIACSPVELLASGYFQRVVQLALAGTESIPPADFVIVDSPALLAVADASVLAAQVDATLVVVRAEKTRASQLVTAIETLNRTNARILGILLNRVGLEKTRASQLVTAIETLNRIKARILGAGKYPRPSAGAAEATNATMHATFPVKEHVFLLQKPGIADRRNE
jgi:capsular exopolysaccharide synthesis family protein